MSDNYLQTTIATYDKTAEEYIVKIQRYAPEVERETFVSLVTPGGKILDAGCGSGRDANYFAAKGFSVTGFDLSEKLLKYARDHAVGKTSFLKMDLRKIEFEDESFDGIWASASLLHLRRDEIVPVLAKFHALLRPGGILMLLMKEGAGEKLVTSGTIQGDTRFFIYVSTDELRTLLGQSGFSVLDMYTWDQKDRMSERPHEIWISCFSRKYDTIRHEYGEV